MEAIAIESQRKLIDIRKPVFDSLSQEAKRRNISLKRFIENTLNETARQLEENRLKEDSENGILGKLIGSAKPKQGRIEDIQDDRLQYLLSK